MKGLGTVVIGGGTGFIGSALVDAFRSIGSKVWVVSRMPANEHFTWSYLEAKGLPPDTSAVINVAGQNVLDPTRTWTPGFKQNVVASRLNTTATLADAIRKAKKPPKVFVTISGVGFYPPSPTNEYTEDSSGGTHDFFARLCKDWEDAGKLPTGFPTRHVIIRSGVVLSRKGGMLQKLYYPYFFNVGGPFGDGKQYMPWIHLNDLLRMFVFAVEEDDLHGVLNGVAPQIITNKEFSDELGRAMWRLAILRVPAFVTNYIFGPERAKMILEGQKVIPKRVQELGFEYQYPNIKTALIEEAY